MHQIIASHASLAEKWIGGRSSRSNHDGSHTKMEKVERVIETGAQDRGWMAGIFGRAKNDDGIGGMNFLPFGGFDNANDSDDQEQKDCTDQQDQQTNPPACRP